MAVFSKRRQITNYIIQQLKRIDLSLDSSYQFKTNVFNNVFRGAENLENINDFPSLYVYAGPELYTYNTVGNTVGQLTLLIRCYLRNGDRHQLHLDEGNLIEDIDHIIYTMNTDIYSIMDIGVTMVDTSQGLLDDYSVIEIKIEITYELDTI